MPSHAIVASPLNVLLWLGVNLYLFDRSNEDLIQLIAHKYKDNSDSLRIYGSLSSLLTVIGCVSAFHRVPFAPCLL